MLVAADKSKTKQRPQNKRGPQGGIPPRLCTGQRSFYFQLPSRRRAIQNDGPFESVSLGYFALPLNLHVEASREC